MPTVLHLGNECSINTRPRNAHQTMFVAKTVVASSATLLRTFQLHCIHSTSSTQENARTTAWLPGFLDSD